MGLRATVQDGRIVLDEPLDLPNGTVVNVEVEDEDDDLDDEQRAALEARLLAGWRSYQEGRGRPVSELLAELRAKRHR